MGQTLRYECSKTIWLITTRTIKSRLWFVNNRAFHRAVAAYLAKYQAKYGVDIFGFIIMGNHYHLVARFPKGNKSEFMRSFNARFAVLASQFIPGSDIGKVWSRRYSSEPLLKSQDVEYWMLYCALNPVTSNLVADPDDYPTYNSYRDAANGRERSFELYNPAGFREAKRRGRKKISISDFKETYTLHYSRLPGHENKNQQEYFTYIEGKRLERWKEELKDRQFPELASVLGTRPGARPVNSKVSERNSKRPLCLTLCANARKEYRKFYFDLRDRFRKASTAYRLGNTTALFPSGTYPPIRLAA